MERSEFIAITLSNGGYLLYALSLRHLHNGFINLYYWHAFSISAVLSMNFSYLLYIIPSSACAIIANPQQIHLSYNIIGQLFNGFLADDSVKVPTLFNYVSSVLPVHVTGQSVLVTQVRLLIPIVQSVLMFQSIQDSNYKLNLLLCRLYSYLALRSRVNVISFLILYDLHIFDL